MVKKHDKMDVQRLRELSGEFETEMSAKLQNSASQTDTLDNMSKIVETVMGFMESRSM